MKPVRYEFAPQPVYYMTDEGLKQFPEPGQVEAEVTKFIRGMWNACVIEHLCGPWGRVMP